MCSKWRMPTDSNLLTRAPADPKAFTRASAVVIPPVLLTWVLVLVLASVLWLVLWLVWRLVLRLVLRLVMGVTPIGLPATVLHVRRAPLAVPTAVTGRRGVVRWVHGHRAPPRVVGHHRRRRHIHRRPGHPHRGLLVRVSLRVAAAHLHHRTRGLHTHRPHHPTGVGSLQERASGACHHDQCDSHVLGKPTQPGNAWANSARR